VPNADTKPSTVNGSFRRVRLIAGQTLAEALRLRLTVLFALVGAMLVLTVFWLREFNFGTAELKFIGDFGLGVIGLLGTLLAVLLMAHLFFSDIMGAAIGCVLTRPVRRWEYIAGKLAGVMALLALFVGALALVLAAVIAVRERQLEVIFMPLAIFLQACALLWLKLTLVAAMTLLVCSYAGSSLFASCGGLLLAVIAHLRPFVGGEGWTGFLRVWPNLGLFDAEPLLAGTELTLAGLLALAGYWLVFVILLGGLASYVFKHREF
jgi:ABC-type transport system involved in multi-copper enzyme maturation permease subunit